MHNIQIMNNQKLKLAYRTTSTRPLAHIVK